MALLEHDLKYVPIYQLDAANKAVVSESLFTIYPYTLQARQKYMLQRILY